MRNTIMFKKSIICFLMLLLTCFPSYAIMIVDIPEGEPQDRVIQCIKENAFPFQSYIHQVEYNEPLMEEMKRHFADFSSTSILETPESTFLDNKLKDIGLNLRVIHIPTIIYELNAIAKFFTDGAFRQTATNNSIPGYKNNHGIKEESVADSQFVTLSQELFATCKDFRTEEDFQKYAKELIQRISSLDRITDLTLKLKSTQKILCAPNAPKVIDSIISKELIDQKTGNISFYRATGGVPYNPNPQKVVNVHPTKLQQINNTLQALNGCFRLDPLTSYEQLKRSLKEASNYDELKGIISLLSRDFNFLDNGYTPHIIDYPFAHTPGTFDKTDKKCKVGKELSFAYTPLSGFLFDGVSASTQSACPFVYAFEHGQYNPYFYTLTYPLVEFMENLNLRTNLQWEYPNIYTSGDFTNFTSLPTVPLHQAILHSGEGFHPRFTFNSLRSYQEELHEFYDHITIISLYGECADTETNKPFVQDMLRRHKDLVLSILDAEEKPHNTNVNQEKRLNDPSLVKVLNYYQSSYPKSDFAKLDAEQSNKLLTRAQQLKKENNIVDGIALNQALKELTAVSEIDSSLVAVLKYYQSAYPNSDFAKLDKEQSNKLLTRAQQLKKEKNIDDGIALNQALKELTAVSEIDSDLIRILKYYQSAYPNSDFAKLDKEQSNKLLTRAHQLKKEKTIDDAPALHQALKELT